MLQPHTRHPAEQPKLRCLLQGCSVPLLQVCSRHCAEVAELLVPAGRQEPPTQPLGSRQSSMWPLTPMHRALPI